MTASLPEEGSAAPENAAATRHRSDAGARAARTPAMRSKTARGGWGSPSSHAVGPTWIVVAVRWSCISLA